MSAKEAICGTGPEVGFTQAPGNRGMRKGSGHFLQFRLGFEEIEAGSSPAQCHHNPIFLLVGVLLSRNLDQKNQQVNNPTGKSQGTGHSSTYITNC